MGNSCCCGNGGNEPNDEIKAKESENKLDRILEEIKQARKNKR
jgi:hypothetical protein